MEIRIPPVGESIHEALLAAWRVADGAFIEQGAVLCDLETDKVNIEVTAEMAGTVQIAVPAGQTLPVGAIIGAIVPAAAAHSRAVATPPAAPSPAGPVPVNPGAARLARERGLAAAELTGSGPGGRVTVDDVMAHQAQALEKLDSAAPAGARSTPHPPPAAGDRPVRREPMSPLRQRIAARLLAARQQTAMLTTFNEADLGRLRELRTRHQEHFTAHHGVRLGLMSFFVKATVEALRAYPGVNARIDGGDIVYHDYYDIGIAVGTDRGLVVPVLRDADGLTFAEIELRISELAQKANDRKLTLAELEGGTFTISNGGIYGSLLSTPILNPPQSGVLGMHAIQERPVARDGQVVVRPMMYLALSYDHRLIDGREAVGFLKLVKEYLEDPEELLLEL
ncbi:MAG: 2-oxoglutarate dehydrogenase complex dihydrolipoyllysine-residue succinyltransferase [Deltaproteobacteria bacterium]|nr:MAG: 2-oxoglutarate dehydrogenase complex dihydrolipoyllysine-residue succinyltransferase [Deltaproteobacteria bacterium]